MKKLLMSSIVLTVFSMSIILFQFSCKKDAIAQTPTPVCDVKGTYIGLSTASGGASSGLTYELRDNNFAVGRDQTNATVTFGGYRNTCDSVVLSVYYTTNSSYYLLEGKLDNNKTTISGTFKNLTTPADFGTFAISK